MMSIKRLGLVALLLPMLFAPTQAHEQPQYRYGAPVAHSFDKDFFPRLVHNTSVLGTVGTKGYDEWQSWGFVEERKPVLHLGVWNKGAENNYNYSLRAVVLGFATVLKAEHIQPADDTSFSETDVGKLETIEFQYTLPQSPKSCLGFQMSPHENPELYVRGYFCAERNAEPNPQVLLCIVNSFLANEPTTKRRYSSSECRGKTVYSR